MKRTEYYRNKHLLGELTIGDLLEITKIEGEFSLGDNWLPITRVMRYKKKPVVGLSMDSYENDPDLEIDLDAKIKIEGRVVTVLFKPSDPRISRVRIRLDREVEF